MIFAIAGLAFEAHTAVGPGKQECLEHMLILGEKQLHRVINTYVVYLKRAWPHHGIQQQVPEPSRSSISSHHAGDEVIAVPILAGLHHDYQKVA